MALQDVRIADGPNLDAFGRLRVSLPVVLFDSQLTYDAQPLIWDSLTTPGGSHTYQPASATNLLALDTTPNGSAVRQSKAFHRYRPGHSLKVLTTFNLRDPVNNVNKRIGYFDPNDGIFLEMIETGAVRLVLRSSVSGVVVDTPVAQANWNLDRMDGTGASAVNLNWQLAQNMVIDLQALYVGRVRVGFYVAGVIVYAHAFNSGNQLAVPFMRTANLPVRYEISANGTPAEACDLLEICSSVTTEAGGEAEKGFPFAIDTGVTTRSFTTTPFPIIAVRPKAAFGSRANHGQLLLEQFEVLASAGAAEFRTRLVYNPTITGGAWVSVHADSIAEVNVTATAMSGGIPIQSGYLNAAAGTRLPREVQQGTIKLPWCVDGSGVQIPVALSGLDLAGTSEALATMQWRELR